VAALIAAIVVVALASAVHGAVGFGLSLLAVPVLLVLDPSFVPGPALMAGLLLSVLVDGRELKAADPRVGWAVLGLLPGTAVGAALIAAVPEDALGVPLGLLVLVAVALSARAPAPGAHPRRSRRRRYGLSGFLATAASVGGPPIALIYARSRRGRFGTRDLRTSAAFAPGVVVGFLLSGPLRPFVDSGRTRPAVLVLSAVAALRAVLQGVLA
jgi:uncharacterized membrane protein YfcA